MEVALTGVGDLAGGFQATSLAGAPHLGDAGQVGHAWDLHLDDTVAGGLTGAQVTLPFDPAAFTGDPADLHLFTYDEEIGAWLPVSRRHPRDVAAGTSPSPGRCRHFSIYAVFDIANWGQTWTALGGTCAPRGEGSGNVALFLDLVFTLDSSGSMAWNDPAGLRRTSHEKSFVDALVDGDRAAVVDFDSWSRLLQGLDGEPRRRQGRHRPDRLVGRDEHLRGGRSPGPRRARPGQQPRAREDRHPAHRRGGLLLVVAGTAGPPRPASRSTRSGSAPASTRACCAHRRGHRRPVLPGRDRRGPARGVPHHREDTGDSGADTDGDGLTDCEEEQGYYDGGGGC